MIFKLHYWLLSAGASASGILLGVFIKIYTDATPIEIGALFMAMPFSGLIMRPLICSFADRYQAHQKFMFWCLFIAGNSYMPFVIIPLMGESFYGKYPRLCWYILVVFQIFGHSAIGGVLAIGDSLAINYAKRIGTDYGIYRVWGTISWITFGIIIGQINEIWFLPKYVPAFMILILCAFLNMSLYWLWPKEYFLMVTPTKSSLIEGEKARDPAPRKSLMPKEVVLAHMKAKVVSLFTCGRRESKGEGSYFKPNFAAGDKKEYPHLSGREDEKKSRGISKTTSLKILLLLVKRDIRIILYFMAFILAGFNNITYNFFFISLADLCNAESGCNYSRLAGLLQVSMGLSETILFMHIKKVEKLLGRVNMAGVSFFLIAVKFTFYGTIWETVNPHYSLLSELMNGVIFSILFTLQVETAHMFANEVEYILPELIEQIVVTEDDDVETLKHSLSATMQAVMTSANDGIGSGFGALIYGLVIDRYSYRTLWLGIGVCGGIACFVTFSISIIDHVLHLDLGLEKKASKQKLEQCDSEDSTGSLSSIAIDVMPA